jgi:hypothetical protein
VEEMMMQTDVLFNEALRLAPLDKARLLDLLFNSFSDTLQQNHEQAWAEQAEKLCDQVDAGQMKMHSIDDVIASFNQ